MLLQMEVTCLPSRLGPCARYNKHHGKTARGVHRQQERGGVSQVRHRHHQRHVPRVQRVRRRIWRGAPLQQGVLLRDCSFNIIKGDKHEKSMRTGVHVVRDISCKGCSQYLGWTYVPAVHAGVRLRPHREVQRRQVHRGESLRGRNQNRRARRQRRLTCATIRERSLRRLTTAAYYEN